MQVNVVTRSTPVIMNGGLRAEMMSVGDGWRDYVCVSLQPDSCNKYNDILEEGVKRFNITAFCIACLL